MYSTEVTGRQILDALDANKSVYARLSNPEAGQFLICQLSVYTYTADDEPCMFQFSGFSNGIVTPVILVAQDCNTPLEEYSGDDPQPK